MLRSVSWARHHLCVHSLSMEPPRTHIYLVKDVTHELKYILLLPPNRYVRSVERCASFNVQFSLWFGSIIIHVLQILESGSSAAAD